MDYDQAVHYLFTLGRELASPQQARTLKFDLENITALMERVGHPERFYPTVHVAGTNGKGSTAAMLASILSASGLDAGLYTSPHLLRINERIRIIRAGRDADPNVEKDSKITDTDFANTFTRILSTIEELLASGAIAAHPTFFECVTAIAFTYFAERRADIAVFEVGMGGRLDSTNIIVPQVAVITQIDFDHENFLGHSIEEIAGEKAGIIKPGAWVVSAAEHPGAQAVIRRRAAEQDARLVEISSTWNIFDVRADAGRYRFTVSSKPLSESGSEMSGLDMSQFEPIQVTLPLAGRFQIRNALTAITAARLLAKRGFEIDDAAIIAGLGAVRWPGRLERLREQPDVYLDGTHNTAGARELLAFWDEQLTGRRIHLVYGAMRDKAVDEVAGLLFPRATTVILTQSPQSRSISAQTLAEMTGYLAQTFEVIPDPAAAFERALEVAAPDDAVFVAGSLYLVGDVSRYWITREAHATETARGAVAEAQNL